MDVRRWKLRYVWYGVIIQNSYRLCGGLLGTWGVSRGTAVVLCGQFSWSPQTSAGFWYIIYRQTCVWSVPADCCSTLWVVFVVSTGFCKILVHYQLARHAWGGAGDSVECFSGFLGVLHASILGLQGLRKAPQAHRGWYVLWESCWCICGVLCPSTCNISIYPVY